MSQSGKKNNYDVCIIGSGPAGSCAAFYLARKGISVVLVDKEKFPRRKICGDAISQRAQLHLGRMGILDSILKEKKGHPSAWGGLVSPGGISYLSDSAKEANSHLMISIKREIMDAKMVNAAITAGTNFVENYTVSHVEFDKNAQQWTIRSKNKKDTAYQAKVLIAADGALSHTGRSLGIVNDPAEAVCSSVYIKGGTHAFKEDGMVFYPTELLPGYAALFKSNNDDVVFCCYIIPGGTLTTKDLKKTHHDLLNNYSYIKDALGPNAEVESMKAAPLRLGGIKKSYGDHLLIAGDAAGFIDPLTGEGIQYAMDSGEIAASVLVEAFEKNDFSEKALKIYQKRWKNAFGKDFKWSRRMAVAIARFPVFLDAFAELSNRRGPSFMLKWAEIMTGVKPKLAFFMPNLLLPLLFSAMRVKLSPKRGMHGGIID